MAPASQTPKEMIKKKFKKRIWPEYLKIEVNVKKKKKKQTSIKKRLILHNQEVEMRRNKKRGLKKKFKTRTGLFFFRCNEGIGERSQV